jgi:hypothetical protein
LGKLPFNVDPRRRKEVLFAKRREASKYVQLEVPDFLARYREGLGKSLA